MELKITCPGYEIAADWYQGSDDKKILVVLPGYSSSKERQRMHAESMVQQTGTSALAVGFSGHGNSPFELRDTRPGQHLLELIYVFDWLKEQHPDAAISVSGSSYGGFLAAHLTGYRKFTNLVLRAPALYPPADLYNPWSVRIDDLDTYEKRMAAYRQDSNALASHPILAGAPAFEGHVLVVVHENDEVVPRATTDAYITAFGADSIIAEGFSHTIDQNVTDPAKLQAYQDHIANWLNKSGIPS